MSKRGSAGALFFLFKTTPKPVSPFFPKKNKLRCQWAESVTIYINTWLGETINISITPPRFGSNTDKTTSVERISGKPLIPDRIPLSGLFTDVLCSV